MESRLTRNVTNATRSEELLEGLVYQVGQAKVISISYVHCGRWHALSIRQHVVAICYHLPWHKVSGSFLGVVLQCRTVPMLFEHWSLQDWTSQMAFSVMQCSLVASLFTQASGGTCIFQILDIPTERNPQCGRILLSRLDFLLHLNSLSLVYASIFKSQ